MWRILTILICLFMATGCTRLRAIQHIDELLTLKGLGEEQESIESYIEEQNKVSDTLFAAVQDGSISEYKDVAGVQEAFGEPIMIRDWDVDGQTLKKHLYRYTVDAFHSPKAYLYFDVQDQLIKWEYKVPEN